MEGDFILPWLVGKKKKSFMNLILLTEGVLTEYVASLKTLINDLVPNKVSLVVQVLIPSMKKWIS